MTPSELIRGLEYEKKKLEGKKYSTFECNVYDMICDCIAVVTEQKAHIELLEKSLEIARCGYES